MRLLVLGGGAREHALVWKLRQSPLVSALFAAPGNPGIAAHAELVAVDPNRPRAVTDFALQKRIDLVVVGPEAPLVAGVADALRAAGVEVFGPSAAAAQVEGSKAFAKDVMLAAGVPTARSEVFDDAQAAAARARAWGPVVVKADGLAAGKGVVVADSGEEAAAACLALGQLPAGKRILLEERLEGPELSVIALCDGTRFVLLPPSQDHKRIFDGDQGPNTGGMGAYAPAGLLSDEDLDEVGRAVIAPTLQELSHRGAEFRGALYAGLMLTKEGPRVLEFNARLGDPETQPLLMMVKDDLVPYLQACARGRLEASAVDLHSGVAVGVVLSAHGYPGTPRQGDQIHGLDGAWPPGVQVFHAGTRRSDDGKLVTAGGRVLTVCAQAESIAAARALAYQVAEQVRFEGRHFRRDIAAKAPVR
ncbi:MAG: phosphoribosylamine--glycine ligase [Myxococcaceae bacterium]